MSDSIENLREVVKKLRGPNGCPWDQKQTLESLKSDLVEETYELVDAIEIGDPNKIREELGDVLLQVVFQSQICSEKEIFTIDDVAQEIAEKLIRRHPHVFGDVKVENVDQVLQNWDAIKKTEKNADKPSSILEGIPKHLPALQKAHQVQKRAARTGFDWSELSSVIEKLDEEVLEFKEAISRDNSEEIFDELGDLLFTMVNLSRFLGHNPEDVLNQNIKKFVERFQSVEKVVDSEGKTFDDLSIIELEQIWQNVKKK